MIFSFKKTIIILLVFSLIPHFALAKRGKGALILDQYTMENVLRYMYGAGGEKVSGHASRKNDPMLMVVSEDGMTADYFNFPKNFLDEISNKIINGVKGINRVVYDITSKPPSTIELE